MAAALDTILRQALELPDDERGELAARLLETLEPPGEVVTGSDWENAWRVEIDRRLARVRAGQAELVDADVALAELRALVEAP